MGEMKKFVQRFGKKIGTSFLFEDFDVEDELHFWALAAEYLSKDEPPAYHDIAHWIDLPYRAPAHFVYVKDSSDKLRLFRRMVVTKNLKKTGG